MTKETRDFLKRLLCSEDAPEVASTPPDFRGTIYNELDPFCCEWLRNLERGGLIAPGRVDGRSIRELQPGDVAGEGQRHFFSGIGIWSLALRMAGWPDEKPVWTGSCPCQPFSEAGLVKGFADERHLWPEWFRLIRECRPEFIFGEQVYSAAGGAWLDLVHADLESVDYTVGAVVLPVASVGGPHIRHRIFFGARRLAHAPSERAREQGTAVSCCNGSHQRVSGQDCPEDSRGRLADPSTERRLEHGERDGDPAQPGEQAPQQDNAGGRNEAPAQLGGLGNTRRPGLPERPFPAHQRGPVRLEGSAALPAGPLQPWRELAWLDCSDGKRRPTQPGLFPLAPRYSGRVAVVRSRFEAESALQAEEVRWISAIGALRAGGNAISPQVAATFIQAFLDVINTQ